ncbi:Ubs1p Ecym_7091 [Eremothecium cymbalariae DBVPG|uniref:Uncharacterized protein n=1 Tax=Eremothecium cymbalariae (strain CBS 270.75 / DBVPG 7215 / KCTC 17166 / NRRL Y-17582) TaxID=931890 RepID=G8JVS8_ERECY|nr:hypothetical protein Ecym_7091 [Eremothecium cymbalariae DBVPG\
MVTSLIRALLRDWKRMQHVTDVETVGEGAGVCGGGVEAGSNRIAVHLKPQDNNLHIWHIVLYNDTGELEIYCMCYFKERNDMEPKIIMKCCTPNSYVPVNRNICLSYLSPILTNGGGWLPFYSQLRSMFFGCAEYRETEQLMKSWNRIVCKEFRWNFPALCGQFHVTAEGVNLVNEYIINENLSMRKKREKLNQGFKFPLDSKNTQNDILACDNSSATGSGCGVSVVARAAASNTDAHHQEEQQHPRAIKRQKLSAAMSDCKLNVVQEEEVEEEEEDYRRKGQ